MIEEIIRKVTNELKDYNGLSEIKNRIVYYMSQTPEMDWTKEDYNKIFDEVLIRLHSIVTE